MSTQHTPGPWTVSNNAIYGSSGLIKPLVAYLDDRFDDAEAANNARLIAAAPDLLELARRIVLADEQDEGDIPADIVLGAAAAIFKVTVDNFEEEST